MKCDDSTPAVKIQNALISGQSFYTMCGWVVVAFQEIHKGARCIYWPVLPPPSATNKFIGQSCPTQIMHSNQSDSSFKLLRQLVLNLGHGGPTRAINQDLWPAKGTMFFSSIGSQGWPLGSKSTKLPRVLPNQQKSIWTTRIVKYPIHTHCRLFRLVYCFSQLQWVQPAKADCIVVHQVLRGPKQKNCCLAQSTQTYTKNMMTYFSIDCFDEGTARADCFAAKRQSVQLHTWVRRNGYLFHLDKQHSNRQNLFALLWITHLPSSRMGIHRGR